MQNIRIVFLGSPPLKQAVEHFAANHYHNFDMIAASSNFADLFVLLDEHLPQILLIESDGNWLLLAELIKKTHSRYSRLKVLLLVNEVEIDQILAFINIGVKGCLLVDPTFDGIENAINLVYSGKLTLSAEITQALLLSE